MENTADKTIITVVGKDTVGIIAKVCTYVSGYFNMMMIVDMNKSTRSFVDCQKDLDEIGAQIGVSIKCQKAEIFEKMHRI